MFRSCCPNGWVDLGPNGCFHFATEAGNLDFYAAEEYCNGLHENAFLAEIKDDETRAMIDAWADAIDINKEWWLGGTDFFEVC